MGKPVAILEPVTYIKQKKKLFNHRIVNITKSMIKCYTEKCFHKKIRMFSPFKKFIPFHVLCNFFRVKGLRRQSAITLRTNGHAKDHLAIFTDTTEGRLLTSSSSRQ